MKGLQKVNDRFSLFNHGRRIGANKRKYIVQAVQKLFDTEEVKEALRLGEAYGYYGHAPRQRAGKLSLGETEVININNKPVVVENIPSNRTIMIACDNDGIVSHTEEFLETETGRIARSLHQSKAGGWSWATGGHDSASNAIATSFHGVDYVLHPNYLSLDHPAMMLESVEQKNEMLLESLQSVGGFDTNSAANIVDSFNNQIGVSPEIITELEGDKMYLEGVNMELRTKLDSESRFRNMLLESLNKLPFYITDEQKNALASMSNEHDFEVVNAMFESMGSTPLETLPTSQYKPVTLSSRSLGTGRIEGEIKFDTPRRFT
ncbi:head processing protein [Vibrio alginolyticus]|uniref:hypothetical protein n=1 Tax=Vibrio alginolyticus TaxID=663 RepID=UPI001DD90696|nr:hypothetical protein [Vibrio alginolyticus]EGR1298295.1 head processing protein [Vibrio alginolyticus]MCS0281072.1 hypothetical protein [Vibrio alginolyticus]